MLFVFDRDNWCSVFPGVAEAENDLEDTDVDAGEYVVFDQDGTVFEPRVDGLHVRLRATDEHDPAQLSERLARFTAEQRIAVPGEDLIAIGNAILAADWEARWPRRPRWLSRRLHGTEPRLSDASGGPAHGRLRRAARLPWIGCGSPPGT